MYDLCIIGFGISGIICAKYAKQNNLNLIILEKNNFYGGCWYNRAFKTSNLQTDKRFYQYKSDNMPKDFPDYPYKDQILKYLNSIIKKYDLNPYYNCKVINVNYNNNYQIKFTNNKNEEIINAKYIAICSGFYGDKNVPYLVKQSKFKGEIIHSGDLKENYNFNNKRVLIIGNGASCNDILKIIGNKTNYVTILFRNNKWYLKRYILGISISIIICKTVLNLANRLSDFFFIILFKVLCKCAFDNKYINLPHEKVRYNNLIINENINKLISQNKLIYIQDKITNIDNNIIYFHNTPPQYIDTIILATGYKNNIPFLNIDKPLNNYLHVFNYKYPNCGFIGFNPAYNWPQVAEIQAELFIKFIINKTKLKITKEIHDNYIRDNDLYDLTYMSFDYIDLLKSFILE